MQKPKTTNNTNTPFNFKLRTVLLIPFVSIFLFTSCSSTSRRREAATRVLENQAEVLEKLQASRDRENLKRKISSDPTTAQAETELRLTIQSLIVSTELMKTAIQN